MTRVLLDGNVYDRLAEDADTRDRLARLIAAGTVTAIATPMVLQELAASPFGGIPPWFPVAVEIEAVAIVGYARVGTARVSRGDVYRKHRGDSKKTPDAIIAHSADALADILISDDRRCRTRLASISQRCQTMAYSEFQKWLKAQADVKAP